VSQDPSACLVAVTDASIRSLQRTHLVYVLFSHAVSSLHTLISLRPSARQYDRNDLDLDLFNNIVRAEFAAIMSRRMSSPPWHGSTRALEILTRPCSFLQRCRTRPRGSSSPPTRPFLEKAARLPRRSRYGFSPTYPVLVRSLTCPFLVPVRRWRSKASGPSDTRSRPQEAYRRSSGRRGCRPIRHC
jgi:hypothetical protein